MSSEGENSCAVLIVDQEPEILVLLSGMLENNGFRTLLARTSSEALEIARRDYLQIDLMLCNTRIDNLMVPDLLTALREIRPGLRAVRMSAFVEGGMIRISVAAESGGSDRDLIAAIRAALRAPRTGAGAAG
jgi:DNA-binding NtrC family response regulator